MRYPRRTGRDAPERGGGGGVAAPAAGADVEPAVAPGESLIDMTRRRFLRTSTVSVAAVGLAGALPMLPSLLGDAEADAPAASAEAPAVAADTSGLTAPITAHVADASTGELSLFVENRTVLLKDPELVSRLLRAAR